MSLLPTLLRAATAAAALGLSLATHAAPAQELPPPAIPLLNYTGETWVGEYLAENAPPALRTTLAKMERMAVFVRSQQFDREGGFTCVALAGISQMPATQG